MAHFEDLQPCTAFPGEWRELLAVGWLSASQTFKKWTREIDVGDLEWVGQFHSLGGWQPPGASTRAHRCELCPADSRGYWSSGAVFVPGVDVLYVAPRMLGHYVLQHQYAPPSDFVRAVRACPSPSSKSYAAAINRHFTAEPRAAAYVTENIVVLEGLEPVRIRPGMYIGATDDRGLENMLFEVVGNSLDEYLAREASRITIDVDQQGWVTVEDDGRGISVERHTGNTPTALEIIFTTLHYGATFDGHHPHVHVRAGLAGAGVSVVNALSSRLDVETRRDGVAHRAGFERGVSVLRAEKVGPTSKRGTRIRYLPDEELFKGARLDLQRVETRLLELARLCPTLELWFQGRSLMQPEGLPGWLRALAPEVVKETTLKAVGTVNDVEVEVALAWRPRTTQPLMRSFVNFAPTGVFDSVERRGLTSAVGKFVGQKRASRKKKVLSGLVAVIHVGLLHPRFGGPTRERLMGDEVRIAVHEVVTRAINEAPWWWDKLHEAIG